MKQKILFMGTPIFAQKILEFLIQNNFNVVGVISQPDKKQGRKQILIPTPTKELATKFDIPTFQPRSIKKDYDFIKELNPDLIITAAYGQIIPQAVLDIPPLGCINIHGSLLPKYRGGAPIHYAIINGDKYTGVTIMEMIAKMDAGNIISQEKFKIKDADNLSDVHDNMIDVACELLFRTLPSILNKSYTSTMQNEDDVVFSPNITRVQEQINFNKPSSVIYNLVRGLNPWPVSYAKLEDNTIKFFKVLVTNNKSNELPGTIVALTDNGIEISTSTTNILLVDFQVSGKKRITWDKYKFGNKIFIENLIFNQKK